jgi:ATP-binding cassette subfamily B protein
MAFLRRYARPHTRRIVLGTLMLVGTNATTFAVPYLLKLAIDAITAGNSAARLSEVAWWLVGTACVGAVFRILSRIYLFYAARDVELEMRRDLYRHALLQGPDFFRRHPPGDIMTRATTDLTNIRLLLGPALLNLLNSVITYVGVLPLMALISAPLTVVSALLFVPVLFLVRRAARGMYQVTRVQSESMGDMSTFVQENLAGAHVVRNFVMEDFQRRVFDEKNEAYYLHSVRLAYIRSFVWRLMAVLANLGTLVVLYFGAPDVMSGKLTLGDFVALVEYLFLLSGPSFAMGWILSLWQRGKASLARIEELLAESPSVPSGKLAPLLAPAVEVRGLSLCLDGREVLHDVDLQAEAGQTLGIVGPVGAGKSILIATLLRQHAPDAGVLCIDGHDISTLEIGALRRMFALVEQRPLLFSMSVEENIRFGQPSATRDQVTRAATMACLTRDIAAFPQGLDTEVGERGIALSGGQKQRVSLARAWLVDAPILVLDDALASVDAETEAAILENLRQARHGKTTLVIAHRLSAVQHADSIVVLDHGRVVQRGTHQTLQAVPGLYQRLVRQQALEQRAAA